MIDIYTTPVLRYSDASTDITEVDYFTNKQVTYSRNHPITGLSKPRYNNFLNRELYDIRLFDADGLFTAENLSGWRGISVVSRLGLLGDNYKKIDGNMLIYKGKIDRVTIDTDYNRKRDVIIECSSELSSLSAISGFPLSKEGWSQVNPNDTSFDKITENAEEVIRRWGDR